MMVRRGTPTHARALLAILATSILLGSHMPACASSLFTDDFSYVAGSALVGQGGWAAHSGAGTNPFTIASPGLTYPGFAGSGVGGMVGTTSPSGEDVNHTFTTQTTGSVYTSFMLNVKSTSVSGDYFFHLMSIPTSTLFYGRLYAIKDAANSTFGLGIRFASGGTLTYTPTTLLLNTTYLVVVKYSFVAGNSNDVVALYINPVLGAAEPAPTLTHSASDGAIADPTTGLGTLALRQGGTTTGSTQQVDGIRMGTTWADVAGASVTHTLTASAGAGGSIAPSGALVVPEGVNQTYNITANACFSIADVLVDGVSVGAVVSYTFTNVTADHTIAASFVANAPSTITATAGAGGTISPAGAVAVNCGAAQAFTIAPDACHTIANVLVDGVSVGAVSAYSFTNVTANHTIAASFAAIPYTITATAGAGGSISPSGAVVVNCGANQAFTFPAASGFALANVVVDAVSVGTPALYTFTNVTANHTIAASFVAVPTLMGPQSVATYICPSQTCVTVPVTLSRATTDPLLGFSVTFQLSANLTLCAGPSSITEGTYLSASGPTLFHVIDRGAGSYTADGVVLGDACGPTSPGGLLFNISVASTAANGPGAITVTSTQLRGCGNVPLTSAPGAPATVPIDNQGPTVTLISPAGLEVWATGSTHAIQWTATDISGVGTIDLAWSSDGGATFPHVIATSLANTGSFNWTVPATSTQIYVRATARDLICSSGSATSGPVGIQSPLAVEGRVTATELQPVIPNPVRSSAELRYTLAARGSVDLSITSVDGRRVRTVVRGVQEAGAYRFAWDGTDDRGARLESGVYFARFETASLRKTRVINLVR